MQTSKNLMDEMAKIVRVVKPDSKLFIGDALAGNDTINQAREFFQYSSFDGAILTKIDADAKGGAAISIAHITSKPIAYVGIGQGYDDIIRFEPDKFIESIFGMAGEVRVEDLMSTPRPSAPALTLNEEPEVKAPAVQPAQEEIPEPAIVASSGILVPGKEEPGVVEEKIPSTPKPEPIASPPKIEEPRIMEPSTMPAAPQEKIEDKPIIQEELREKKPRFGGFFKKKGDEEKKKDESKKRLEEEERAKEEEERVREEEEERQTAEKEKDEKKKRKEDKDTEEDKVIYLTDEDIEDLLK